MAINWAHNQHSNANGTDLTLSVDHIMLREYMLCIRNWTICRECILDDGKPIPFHPMRCKKVINMNSGEIYAIGGRCHCAI